MKIRHVKKVFGNFKSLDSLKNVADKSQITIRELQIIEFIVFDY